MRLIGDNCPAFRRTRSSRYFHTVHEGGLPLRFTVARFSERAPQLKRVSLELATLKKENLRFVDQDHLGGRLSELAMVTLLIFTRWLVEHRRGELEIFCTDSGHHFSATAKMEFLMDALCRLHLNVENCVAAQEAWAESSVSSKMCRIDAGIWCWAQQLVSQRFHPDPGISHLKWNCTQTSELVERCATRPVNRAKKRR